MTKVAIQYDYLGVDQVVGTPSTGQLIVFQKQVAKIQTSYKCNIPEAKDHGWLWIMCTPAQWILKRGITAQVTAPTDLGLYTGNTNSPKLAYKQKLKLYEEYKEHKQNTNKVIQACFDEDLLIDLESDGILLGVTPMQVYQHMCNNFLLKVDKDQEIWKTKELLKVEYDPDRIVQHYHKQISEARVLLTALRETVTDAEIMQNAYATFEQHIDLKEACWE